MILTLFPEIVHLWQVDVTEFINQQQALRTLLSAAELQRADRFRFPLHRERYVVARAMLRKIISLYIQQPAEKITFALEEHGKPFLSDNPLGLQFNLSHSNDRAVYAITLHHPIGVDIEKISNDFKQGVAQRYFTLEEYSQLMQLPEAQRIPAFYSIWVKKEAVIKSIGKGLYQSIADFAVHWNQAHEEILLDEHKISVSCFNVDPQYAAAFAIIGSVKTIQRWVWHLDGYKSIPTDLKNAKNRT